MFFYLFFLPVPVPFLAYMGVINEVQLNLSKSGKVKIRSMGPLK